MIGDYIRNYFKLVLQVLVLPLEKGRLVRIALVAWLRS